MINKEFIEETDKLIKLIQEKNIQLENGNVLIAKVKTDRVTSGGIHLADGIAEREDYKKGFGRVLAVAPMTPDAVAEIKIGSYVVHSHEARYKPYPETMHELLGRFVDKDLLYTVQRADILLQASV